MKLFNKLSDYDKKVIEYYIDYVGYQETFHARKAPLETLLEAWNYQKDDLFTLLGENLIVSKDIIFDEGLEQVADRMYSFLWKEGYAFRQVFENMVAEYFNSYQNRGKLYEKAKELNPNNPYINDYLYGLMSSDRLSANAWNGESFIIPLPNGKTYRVCKGHKITKIIAKLAKEFQLDGYEDFRIGHSQVLNTRKFDGTLHLSIHPMDFMTMSDNTYGWDSCLNWENHGDYHGGAITMMTSPMVVVAYLTGSETMPLTTTLSWNSKKWRELFIVDPRTITAIKGYPFDNEYLDQAVLDWLRELAETNLGWTYGPQVEWGKEHSIEGYEEYSVTYHTGNTMYNDMYSKHPAMYNTDKFENKSIRIKYEGPRICMVCGEEDMCFDTEATIACEYCEDVYHCTHCGARIFDLEESYTTSNGDIYCECCADNLVTCSECGDEAFYLEDIDGRRVYLGLGDIDHILMHYYVTFCGDCFKNSSLAEKTNTVTDRWGGEHYYVNINDLTKDELGEYFAVVVNKEEFIDKMKKYGVFLRIFRETTTHEVSWQIPVAPDGVVTYHDGVITLNGAKMKDFLDNAIRQFEKFKKKCYNKL